MRSPGDSLPMPGEVVYSEEFLERRPQERGEREPLRVVQWNIERGYKMREIIAMLREADPDVATIQEIDIDCDRSENVDTLRTLAAALGMAYVFVAEFEELRSPARSARDQGGGVHGNCILSKFPLRGCRAIKHRHQIVDWAREGLARGEPRRGFRYTVTALVDDVPGWGGAGPLRLYSSHLEVFCSAFQRAAQFCDVFDDSRASEAEDGARMQIVGGDLNTMGHGIARLSPKYCGHDWARFWTLGQSEGGWFARNVLHGEVKTDQGPQEGQGQGQGQEGRRYNASLRWWGLPQDVCESAVNNGFEDPYDVEKDITIESYAGWYYGKLDWTLLKGLACTEKSLANHDYSASDHKLLSIKVVPQ